MKPHDEEYQRDFRRYAVGLLIALITTYSIYLLATQRVAGGLLLAGLLLLIAITQLVVQMRVFLHLEQEERPRWTLWSIVCSAIMTMIVIIGSLWVMYNLNYNMHVSPEQMNDYMLEQNKKGF